MMNRPSIQDIARETGYAMSTVSLALRRSPKVRPATAEKIRAAAERMDYHPDPVVAGIAARRWKHQEGGGGYTIAFLRYEQSLLPIQRHKSLEERARERALQHGYAFEVFDLTDYASGVALSRVLRARGIRGIIVPRRPFLGPTRVDEIEWSSFAVVSCGTGRKHLPFHTVSADVFRGMEVVVAQLLSRGYRRIGFAFGAHEPIAEEDMLRVGSAQALQWRERERLETVPVFTGDLQDRRGFLDWFEAADPDVVVSLTIGRYWTLRDAGRRIPEEVGFAALNAGESCAGLESMERSFGRGAVDALIHQMQMHEWGIPKRKRRILILPQWVEGQTLRVPQHETTASS